MNECPRAGFSGNDCVNPEVARQAYYLVMATFDTSVLVSVQSPEFTKYA
jgi:hypothetical protein